LQPTGDEIKNTVMALASMVMTQKQKTPACKQLVRIAPQADQTNANLADQPSQKPVPPSSQPSKMPAKSPTSCILKSWLFPFLLKNGDQGFTVADSGSFTPVWA
jgi:hypothetical protein